MRCSESGSPGQKPVNRGREQRDVVTSGRPHDRMGRVEVPVRQLIAHPGNLIPWDAWLLGEKIRIQIFHRLADLDQTDPDRVEDDVVVNPSRAT